MLLLQLQDISDNFSNATVLCIENAASKKINDITVTLQAKYDTLIYAYNDSLSFYFSKINK